MLLVIVAVVPRENTSLPLPFAGDPLGTTNKDAALAAAAGGVGGVAAAAASSHAVSIRGFPGS